MPGEYLPPVVSRLVGDIGDVLAKIAEVKAAMRDLGNSTSEVNLKFGVDKASLVAAETAARVFVSNSKGITIPVGAAANAVEFARVRAAADMLSKPVVIPVKFDMSQLNLLTAALAKATGGGTAAAPGDKGGGGGGLFGFLGGFLGGKHTLYGGLLGTGILARIGGIHLLVDGIAEVAAVLIPATMALIAFGAAGAATFNLIVDHLSAVHTVITATGQAIAPLTGGFTAIENAVRPDVMQLYGDALSVVNHKMGAFSQLAVSAGSVIAAFAARATVAFESGGMSQFLKNASSDLAGIFNVLGNVAGTIGNVLKALPGYAQKLLVVLQVVTHAMESFTGSGFVQDLLKAGLAMHGAWLYAGLLVGGIMLLKGPLLALGGWVMGGIEKLAALRVAFMATAAEEGVFAAISDLLSPWGWVAVGIGALTVLGIWLSRSKTATQQWLDTMQGSLDKASMFTGLNQLYGDLGKITVKLDSARQQLDAMGSSAGQAARGFAPMDFALFSATNKVNALSAGQTVFLDEAKMATYRLGGLAGQYGGLTQATTLAALAGVKFTTVLHGSHQQWLAAIQQIASLVLGYKEMGQAGSLLANDVNAVTYATSDQLAAMGKLNQAWDTFITNVAAPRSTFVSFAQSIVQYNSDLKTAGGGASTFGGKVQAMARQVTTSGLQLQSDFQASYTAAGQLFDAMRTAGTPGAQFTKTVKDAVAVLLPLAGNSKAALGQISALAQEASGPATTSAKVLARWVGNIHNPMLALQGDSNKASIALSNLSLDAQKLSTTLQQDLNTMMAKSIEYASGAQAAMNTYSLAIRNNTQNTAAGHADRQRAWEDLYMITHNATETNTIMRTLTSSVGTAQAALGKFHSENIKVAVYGFGHWQIGSTPGAVGGLGGNTGGASGKLAAAGWRVPGYGGGDKHPALLEGGEAVVPKHLVHHIAPFLGHHKVPGFAAGGLVPSYKGSVGGIGPWATSNYNATISGFANSLSKTVSNAMSSAMSGAFGGAGALGGNVQGWVKAAMAITGVGASWYQGLLAMIAHESGGNPAARNPSGASGIAQTMPGTFAAYSLGGSMWSPIADLVAAIRYILARYGTVNNIPNLYSGRYQGYANGTSSAAPGWAVVGEKGPELVGFSGGQQVIPNNTLGGGDIVIQIDGRTIARVTQKEARAYNRRNGSRGSNTWANPA